MTSTVDWQLIERWLMGEAWTGSRIQEHLRVLCDEIGPRWSSSAAEKRTTEYICREMTGAGLADCQEEGYILKSWRLGEYSAHLAGDNRRIDVLPFNRCPPLNIVAPVVDVGFGTTREIEAQGAAARGAAAVMTLGFEPFTDPIPLTVRLSALAAAGAAAAIVVERKDGGRMEYHSAGDWSQPGPDSHPIPTVVTSREDGAFLRRIAPNRPQIHLSVKSEFYEAPSQNTGAILAGTRWPQEHLILGAHHDTVYGTPGGNDNASGVCVVLETARVLAQLQTETGTGPGCSIRFVTFSAEEQTLQGSAAYVERHYATEQAESRPRLVINLDELATGTIKGLVLAFPHLRKLVQEQFDAMGDGLQCHTMSQLDSSSDHYPFLRAGIDAAHLWRWRFHGRRADADFHHEPGDTSDKVNVRELKEYVGQLARLLLRLSHVEPASWPQNPHNWEVIQKRIEHERGRVIRVS